MSNFTPIAEKVPPRDTLIEWIAPDGRLERGKWAGGAVWFPEGSKMYIYYTPAFWRLADTPHVRTPE